MDSHQILRFGVNTSSDLPNNTSSQFASQPSALYRVPVKFRLRNSPNSPFSAPFDCVTTPTLSDSLDHQQSSTENLSGASPTCNSSNETHSYSHWSSPSLDLHQQDKSTVLFSSARTLPSQSSFHGGHIQNALLELETALMGEEEDDLAAASSSPSLGENRQPQLPGQVSRVCGRDPQPSHAAQPVASPPSSVRDSEEGHTEKHHKAKEETLLLQSNPSGNLKSLLVECAKALSDGRLNDFERLVEEARGAVSIAGEPIQRLGAYMIEGLVARKQSSGTNIYRALRCKEPLGKDLLSYMHILYEICPYLKFGYMAANGAIAEACRNEDLIHIIDFGIAQGTQWLTLLQALAARPGGPPRVRITGIDDPVSEYARGAGLEAVGRRLAAISEKYRIEVEFHPVPVFAPDVTRDMLDVRPGEALAVNFPLQLHHTPDESVDVNNPRDGLLRMVKSLSPKVTTLVEQESNTNTTPFLTRFVETLDYYSAMFESIDVTMPRDRKERINVEQHCLAKDIVNVIACEGKERVERHELFGKWKSRFTMAGFQPYQLSGYVNSVIRGLLRCYSENYTLAEKDGAMLLGWKERMLISASAWH